MILGDEKSGKTSWLLAAAESGFNVLLLDGDVAQQRINDLSPEAKSRVYYMDVSDNLVGTVNPKMIQTVADFFVAKPFLWNDTKQAEYSRSKDSHDPETGACLDEVWEIRPGLFDHTWIIGLDSWTSLQYSAKLAKAEDMGVDLADVEKIERNIYSGVGNRLTNIAFTQQKAKCHTVFIGHPTQYEKRKSESGKTVKEAMKENDQIIEWTKMIPISSSNPHGYSIGKYFSDIGWIDVSNAGKRVLNFLKTGDRTSGGNLNSKGDPRLDHRFEDLVRKIGGTVPDGNQGPGPGLIIHEAGTYIPATAAAKKSPLSKSATSDSLKPEGTAAVPTQVKGIGGLGGLLKK
ncbi:MAG: hypothetical protein ACRCZI_09830 [Cetobacterium sp.]